MALRKAVFILSFILVGSFGGQADKYTDENRPYEFGFSIDGEQHRHEKKDENGIIMGEFGFITADGVYHVTVYATDENGNFKIISMKNIRVKPYPTAASAKDTRTGHALSISPQTPASKTPAAPAQTTPSYSKTTPPPQQTKKLISPLLEPARACSHCSLPTTTTVKPIYSDINDDNTTLNKEKGLDTSGKTNEFGANKANSFESVSNVPQTSNTGNNGNINSGVIRPQTNNVYNSPNLSDGISLIPNISQLPLDNNAQSYGPLDEPGFSKQYPTEISNQNNYQGSVGSSLPQSLQGNNPQQKQQEQKSSIDNSQPRPQFGNVPSIGNSVNEYSSGNKNYPPNAVGSSVGNRENENERNPGPISAENTSNNQNNPQNTVGNFSPVSNEDSAGERNPKKLNSYGQAQYGGQNEETNLETSNNGKPEKPVLISAQMQIVDKNTDVYSKKPGEKDGLPDGLTKGDMENLLYTFNYTLAFHGHYEEGYTNGAKQGYYFVTGRNGVRTRIDYVADENGFRPKITQEVLDLISEDVPKPETEKDEKFGLKGYEFKWLYFPVGSKP